MILATATLPATEIKHVHTPNIDSLGIKGARFTQAYVTSPICAPSRMGIITGRYQQRFGAEFMLYDKFDKSVKKKITSHFFSFKKKPVGIATLKPDFFLNRSVYVTDLPASEITIAEMLKQKGYSTGYVGKWNLTSSPTCIIPICMDLITLIILMVPSAVM